MPESVTHPTTRRAVMPIVRVAVLATGAADDGAGRVTDMALPTELPLREILPVIRRMALAQSDDADAAGLEQLSLAPIGGAAFSLEATLDTVGVVDGDLLALQRLPNGPAAPRIVEDIADAAAIFSAARDTPWGPHHLERAAAIATVGLILFATVVATVHRTWVGGYLGLATVGGVAVLTVLASLLTGARYPRLATALAVTALAPVAAAFAVGVPGTLGAPGVLLAAAGVTAWSVIGITVGQRAIAVFTTASVAGLGTLVAAGAVTIWALNAIAVGCVLILIALLVTVQAARLSALWARFPAPAIPAPGDPAPSAPSVTVLADLPRRVRLSDSHQTGFIAGGVLLAVAGSVILVAPQGVSVWAWYLVAAVALGTVLRARVWDSTSCKAWLLSQPYLLILGLGVVFLIDGRYAGAGWALVALALLTVAWVIVAGYPSVALPETYSLPMRRMVGFLATALDASLIPVMAHLVGVFTWVLNR